MTLRPLYNVYIASGAYDGGIYQYEMDDRSGIRFIAKYPLGKTVYMECGNDKLYALLNRSYEDDSEMVAFSMDKDGNLYNQSELLSTKGKIACHLALDGETVYCANYISGSLIKMPDHLVTHAGKGLNPVRQEAPHTHFVCLAPDKKYICVTDLGLDKVIIYDKNLQFVSEADVPSGHGARHLVFSRDGKILYCANELASTVTVFYYYDGALQPLDTYSVLPEDFNGESYAAAIRLSQDGTYLYVSNRGHDSICCFKIEGNRLSREGFIGCGGHWPRDFYIVDDLLLCANERSDNVTVYKINGSELSKLEEEIKLPVPFSVIAFRKEIQVPNGKDGEQNV